LWEKPARALPLFLLLWFTDVDYACSISIKIPPQDGLASGSQHLIDCFVLSLTRGILEPAKMVRYQMPVFTAGALDDDDTFIVGGFGELVSGPVRTASDCACEGDSETRDGLI